MATNKVVRANSLKDLPFEFTYTGFDTNTIWNPIQGYIASLSSYPDKVSFCYEDVFEHYAKVDEHPNVIILNYKIIYEIQLKR